ncbi:MAG: CDP-alcohol phosphatidyltransferase family protein [Alphaproteobacteria bacterium GM7ARS4]|nr:CDP-alcohol phosphatidyltransferase family protein [Alphaproteobacteria bacterium GM7ARS4]
MLETKRQESHTSIVLSYANVVSLVRLVSAPVVLWLILESHIVIASMLFVLAALTDMIDGVLARFHNETSHVGVYLDPLADKVLLLCVYVTIGVMAWLPLWFVIIIVFRDMFIIVGIVMAYLLEQKRADVKPLFISKVNTALQFALALWVLLGQTGVATPMMAAFPYHHLYTDIGVVVVATTTVISGLLYLRKWWG